MPQSDKTIETPSGAELRSPDPAITIATLAGILGCDGDEKACLRTITEIAQRSKTVETVVAEQKASIALVKATRASLNLPEGATEADVTKAIVDLQARSTKLTELEPKLVSLEKDVADRDEATAEREVTFLIKRGADYKLSYGETAKRGLLAFRKADPKGFAEDHKAALDGLRAFDDAKTFAPVAVAKTEQRAGLTPSPEQSAGAPVNPYTAAAGDEDEALERKADDIQKDAAAKGAPMKRSVARDLAAKAL